MKIGVTGAAGFIGSHLCAALLARDDEVVALDNLSGAYAAGGPWDGLGGARAAGLRKVRGDATDPAVLTEAFSACEVIVHLAGRGGARGSDMATYARANVTSTHAVMEAARRNEVRRVLLASSSSVYAPSAGPVSEAAATEPASPYGASKLRAEQLAAEAATAIGTELTVLRYFTVYGPGQRPDMLFARFLAAGRTGVVLPIFHGASRHRDFTFVTDAVAGTLAAIRLGEAGATYNLSGGRSASVPEALELLGRISGFHPRRERRAIGVVEQDRSEADLSHARAVLGYQPAVDLEEGLTRQAAHAARGLDGTSRSGRVHRHPVGRAESRPGRPQASPLRRPVDRPPACKP